MLTALALSTFVCGSLPSPMRGAADWSSTIVTARTYQSRYARIRIDGRGFVTALVSRLSGREYSPQGHPSPLLSVHDRGALLSPLSASFHQGNRVVELRYSNGATATVKIAARERYFRFQLTSLSDRGTVDDIVWGPINTTVSQTIGDLIGVVRDKDWAIGLMGLDDNTISGPPVDGDCYGMSYIIHSPDPIKHPVPPPYKEGQRFNIGGDGISDVAFYSHPEEFFQQAMGTGATLEPAFGSTLACHSRDRRQSRTHLFSLLPGFPGSRPRHQVSDPVGVDFTGSAVALYACPDELGLKTIEDIETEEGLPHITFGGRWIRDPGGLKPDIAWYGQHDKLIEYANALGLRAVQDEGQGEYYANPADHWQGNRVGFSGGKSLTYKEYTAELAKFGIKYGLHTLCLFLQPGRCTDVSPIPSPHLQTVLRTKLAHNVSSTDTDIVVTDPSFLAEDGTWPMRDGSNTLRIGNELLTYTGIQPSPPFVLRGVKRGQFGTSAQSHSEGDELAKLQMNCYNGFVPDMTGMLDYADYYATVMAQNGMEYIDFDGLESTLYQNHGYYGVRRFFRRFFDTFPRLTGGKAPRVMGSCVFAGGWEYMSVCNVGGGNNMFDPVLNRWGIEGKDIRNGFSNSYFPPTFGIQNYHSDWSIYDAENLEAKSIGWGATYMLGLSEASVERSGEKARIFKAFRAWEEARAAGVFTPGLRQRLRDLDIKFHLDQVAPKSFVLTPVTEFRESGTAATAPNAVRLTNRWSPQPLDFSLRVSEPVGSVALSLPDGTKTVTNRMVRAGQFIIASANHIYLADADRRKIDDLRPPCPSSLSKGSAKLTIQFPGANSPVHFDLTVWVRNRPIRLSRAR